MAVARKCDRCGAYTESCDFSINFGARWGLEYETTEYDLCRCCATQFLDFMNGTKPTTLRELLREKFKRKD